MTATIENLEVGPSAHFQLRHKRLTNAAIERLFNQLRSQSKKPSPNLFRHVREAAGGGVFSAICFSYERSPDFLDDEAQVFDRVHGFLLIVERGDYVAVLKSGLDLPARFKTNYLRRADRDRVEAAVATADAIFERLRVQSTSPSKQLLRAKTLEAADLESSMPMASAGGYFTQAYAVRRKDGHFSATPSTGRIAKRAGRGPYEEAIDWCAAVIDELASGGAAVAPFIRNFARRLDLDSLAGGTAPILFAVNIPTLTELLLSEQPTMRLVQLDGATGQLRQLTTAEVEAVMAALDEGFPVRAGRPDYLIRRGNRPIGVLRIGKTRIALRKLDVPALGEIEIERSDVPVGTDEDRQLLVRHIDKEDLFTVLFTDPALAYVDGELFRNNAMLDGGSGFLRHLLPEAALASATSEKGDFVPGQIEFSPDSVFRKIVDSVAAGNDILVCDDLGNEWADFLGINTQTRPPSINFYHGKYGPVSLSASAFHDAVGQAQKNLGQLDLPPGKMPEKLAKWTLDYVSGSSVQTAIPRIVAGGTAAAIATRIDEMRGAPDAVRHVYIVTSSLSKAQVAAQFADLAAGGRATAHFVQLYWLLQSYFNACAEMGSVGFVICRP